MLGIDFRKEWAFFKKRLRKQLSRFWSIGVRGRNNKLVNHGTLSGVIYDIAGHENLIIIERGAVLENLTIYMRGNRHRLVIGESCRISGGSLWFEDEGCTLEMGRKTSIESCHLAVTEPGSRILIGEDCMFAHRVQIRTGDSHSIVLLETGERINHSQNVSIGNHVWLGENVAVLKGVHIGDNSIVGLGSILTQGVPENCLAVGCPAKVVKTGVEWKRERLLRKVGRHSADDC